MTPDEALADLYAEMGAVQRDIRSGKLTRYPVSAEQTAKLLLRIQDGTITRASARLVFEEMWQWGLACMAAIRIAERT